jgi:hypothetical protein
MDPILSNPGYIIFAAILPLLIAVIRQEGWSPTYNSVIAVGCYFVVGILGVLTSGLNFTLDNVVGLIALGAAIGQAAYAMFWSQIFSNLAQRIERATSIVKAA